MTLTKRSPAAPTQSLSAAIERARLLHQKAHENWIPLEVVAEAWKLSTKSSSFSQAVATQLQFGLLEEQGSRENRELKLTDNGLDIVTYPNTAAEWLRAVQECACSPPLHSEVLARFNGTLPPDDGIIRVYLLRQREGLKFHQDQVDGFIRQLRETFAFAKLNDSATINKVKDETPPPPNAQVKIGDYVQWTSQGIDQLERPARVLALADDADVGEFAFVEGSATGLPMSELTVVDPPASSTASLTTGGTKINAPPANPFFKPAKDTPREDQEDETTNLVEGPVSLRWPKTLSETSVDELEYWLNGVIRRARRKAGLPADKRPESKT